MKQIKNNFKFSNDKNYNEKFLDELEKKEEFDCVVNTCVQNERRSSCTIDGCAENNRGVCEVDGCTQKHRGGTCSFDWCKENAGFCTVDWCKTKEFNGSCGFDGCTENAGFCAFNRCERHEGVCPLVLI